MNFCSSLWIRLASFSGQSKRDDDGIRIWKMDTANSQQKSKTSQRMTIDHRPSNGNCRSTVRSIHNQVWCLVNSNWYFVDASVAVAADASLPLIIPLNCRHCYCLPFDESAFAVAADVDVDFVHEHGPLYPIHLRRLLCTLDYLMMSRLPYFRDYLIARSAMEKRRGTHTHGIQISRITIFLHSPSVWRREFRCGWIVECTTTNN